jgi:uncharacterized repeat protein (TIGR01451 family)
VTGSSTISLSGASVPVAQSGGASGQCDIDVEVTSTATSTVQTNTIPAGAVSGDDTGPVSNGSQAQQSITVNNMNAPAISKGFSRTTVVKSDQTVRLSITISNASNPTKNLPLNTATDSPAWAIRDVLPSGLQVASTPNATASCTGAGVAPTFNPSAAATTLLAIGGTVAAAGSCTLAVDLVGTDTGGAYSKSVTNTIDRAADFGNKRGLVPASNASANLSIVSLLQVSKSFSPSTVAAGQIAPLIITMTNASPLSTVSLTSFTDNPIDGVGAGPYGLKVNSVATTCSGAGASITGGNTGVTLTGGSIPPSANCNITVNYVGTLQSAGAPQSFTNTIATGAIGTTDPTIFSQPASHSVTVIDQLTISKGVNTGTAGPGNPVQYSLTVNNYSATALNNVRITDVLPSGMIALPSSPAAPSLSGTNCLLLTTDIPALPLSSSTPHFTIGTVPAGVGPIPSVCTVVFWAMPPTGATVGSKFNNAIGTGGVADGNGNGSNANASASNSVQVTIASVATISKVFNPSSAFEGTVSHLKVTFSNLSAQPLSNASFTDNLPLGSSGLQLTLASPANASSTCSGATLTAVPGSSSVSMSGATIPARANNGGGALGTCSLTVDVIGPAGNYTNTLPQGALTATETYADGTTHTASSVGPVSASLSYASALTASKQFSPATISSGGRSTVTVQLGNVGTGILNNVSVTDPLPGNMVVATPSNAYTTCGGTPAITAAPNASSVVMAGAVIPASGQCNLLFDVTATGSANWTNNIPQGNVSATGGVQNVAPVTATLTNSTLGGVTVTNNVAPNSLTAPGQVAVLSINIANSGTVALTGVGLTNYFTANGLAVGVANGMVVSSNPGATTTCNGAIISASGGAAQVGLSGASLAAGANCTLSVNVTLNVTGTVQDTIPLNAISTSQGVSNTLVSVTSLSASANIGVSKTFIPPVIKPGDRSRLRITFINPLSIAVTSLAATDNLVGMTVPAGANPSTTCSGAVIASTANQVTISGGSLPPASNGASATCVAEIDVTAATTATYSNQIAAHAVTGIVSGSSVNNPVAATATLQVSNPVTITKSFSPATVPLGTQSTLTITLNNSNSIALTGAVLVDALPSNLTVGLTPSASTTCGGTSVYVASAPSATSIALTGATIPAGSSCTVTVNVVSNFAGTYVNTIPGGALSTLEGVTNELPNSGTVVVQNPPTVGKQFSPASIAVNGTSVLTIVLGNTNATAATLTADLVDTLPTSPANIVIAPSNGLSGTCLSTGTVALTAGSITLQNGSTIPAGGCTISVNVTGNLNGTYNNAIPVGALQTTLGSNLIPATANLVISPLGYISGRVFNDNALTPNGVYGSPDTPVANAAINLTGTDYGSSGVSNGGTSVAFSASTTTDALGNYYFTGLNPGSYTVTRPGIPTGTLPGITTAGTISGVGTAGVATASSATPGAIANIVLLRNAGLVASSADNNFSDVIASTISGTVFLDANDNGVYEAADSPLQGVAIELWNASGTVVSGTTTGSNGVYSFSGLGPGTYSIHEPLQPANTANGISTAGSVGNGGHAGTATPNTVVPSVIANIALPPNTSSQGNNFAEVPTGRQMRGRVFVDVLNTGVYGGNDYGIGGVSIQLSGTDLNNMPVTQTTSTAADGSYVFSGLAAGTYVVTEPVDPVGTTSGRTSAGTTGGTVTAVGAAPSFISAINLNGTNTISANNNFPRLVGLVPDLTLVMTHSPASFGAGSTTGYYTLTASNVGPQTTSGRLTVIDNLPAGITLTQTPAGTGWTCTGAAGASSFTCTTNDAIAAGANGPAIIVRVAVAPGLQGQTLTNTASISGGAEPVALNGNNTANDPTPIAVGASVSGHVWLDVTHDRNYANASDYGQAGWGVQLVLNGVVVASTSTAADGAYIFSNVAPGTGYQIRFLHPGNNMPWGGAVPNESATPFTSGVNAGVTNVSTGIRSGANPAGATTTGGTLSGLTLASGIATVQQSLPIDPTGIVYDAVSRLPVAAAVVTISGPTGFTPATDLVGGQASETTGVDGRYQFLLNPTAPSGTYRLAITAYPAGYATQSSAVIPPCTATLNVGPSPAPALIQVSNTAPNAATVVATPAGCPSGSAGLNATNEASTQYFLSFQLSNSSANVINNHIPIDPLSSTGFVLSKTADRQIAQIGDTVRYTVEVRLNSSGVLPQVTVRDHLPPGFTLVPGTVQVNGLQAANPVGGLGPLLAFNLGLLRGTGNTTAVGPQAIKLQYRVRVGIGAQQGNGINTAMAVGCSSSNGCVSAQTFQPLTNSVLSNQGSYKVTVSGGVFTDQACVLGKIYVECNNNHIQDDEEIGIPGVRLYFEDGTYVVSDSEGKYSRCGMTPRSHVLTPDPATLPQGSHLTTSSNRNLGDANSLFVDLKNGELHRADFIEGSCSNRVLEQVKARRTQGEVRSVETERANGSALRFESKSPGYPLQGTDSANQPLVKPRQGAVNAQ